MQYFYRILYPVIKLGKAPTHTQADMEYEPVGTQGEKQSIELQSNAAYASSVKWWGQVTYFGIVFAWSLIIIFIVQYQTVLL